MKIVVFDIGGTLMEFKNMPLSWVDNDPKGFRTAADKFGINISDAQIDEAVNVLIQYNPRINYREIEYPPAKMFEEAVSKWNISIPTNDIMDAFFDGFGLEAVIYPDTLDGLTKIRKAGLKIAALTDLPSGMPDRYFKLPV